MGALTFEELVMRRCFQLARLGAGRVKTNPMVGAVLVVDDRIIGEGYHPTFGGPHAEVQAVGSVPAANRHLFNQSTLFVSLEPCCTYGKTPPCTKLILEHQIPRVILSSIDPAPGVQGKSIKLLREQGVQVTHGILEKEGEALIQPFRTNQREKRPYIILKFAQTTQGYFAPAPPSQFWITDPVARRLVHKWRSEVDAILIGYQTALTDNPSLTNRYFFGPSPIRVVLDPKCALPNGLNLWLDQHPTIRVIQPGATTEPYPFSNVEILEAAGLQALLGALLDRQIGTLLIEGGAYTIRQFMEQDLWDEARILTGPNTFSGGIPAPSLHFAPAQSYQIGENRLDVYRYPRLQVR